MGENFLANYNVTILDIARVTIGDYVMIGPNTLITTVNPPCLPEKGGGISGRQNLLPFPIMARRSCWSRYWINIRRWRLC